MEIQELINASERVTIPAGEYEGPFLINRPANVTADGSVLLYVREPGTAAANISSPGVTLSGLSFCASSPCEPALLLLPDTVTTGVSVFGSVIGNPREEGFFDIPYSLFIGDVAPSEAFELTVKISLPVPAVLEPQRGVSVSQTTLPAGVSTVGIRLPAARAGSILRCSVYVKTAVIREMIFTAAVSEKAKPLGYAPLLFEPESSDKNTFINNAIYGNNNITVGGNNTAGNKLSGNKLSANNNAGNNATAVNKNALNTTAVNKTAPPEPQKVTATPVRKSGGSGNSSLAGHDVRAGNNAANNQNSAQSGITYILPKPAPDGTRLSRGMHYPLAENARLEVQFFPQNTADVDAYVFLHDGTMKITDSKNLLFFGNDTAAGGAVTYLNTAAKRAVFADLQRIPDVITELDFIYASYDEGIVDGNLRIKTPGETLFIPLSGSEKTVTAFELVRSKAGFTLTPLIMPYRRGIRELIKSYGLAVT